MTLTIGDVIPAALTSCDVLDRDDNRVTVGSLLAGRATLVVFLRHFGCIGCSAQVTDLAPRLGELQRLGIRTLFIGNGAPDFIAHFIERFALSTAIRNEQVDILTDPTLSVHRAAALSRSFWGAYGPLAIWDFIRLLGNGHVNRATEGDNFQQGGALLVDAGGIIAWYHRSNRLAGHAPSVDVVDAAMQLALAPKTLHA